MQLQSCRFYNAVRVNVIEINYYHLTYSFLEASAEQFNTIPGGPWNREVWTDARLTMLFNIIGDLVAIQSVVVVY